MFFDRQKVDELRCPGCDAEVRYEREVPKDELNSTVDSDSYDKCSDIIDDSPPLSTPASTSPTKTYEEMRKEYEAKNKTLNDISSKLGQRMLQGWTMLGTSCPKPDCRGTPLMSLNGQSLMECVSCDEGYNILDGEPVALSAFKQSEATSVQPRSGRLSVSSQTVLTTPPPLTSTRTSKQYIDIISEKIGHKLLQGWCILSEVCESVSCHGSVPLMKDTKGRVSRYLTLSYLIFTYTIS